MNITSITSAFTVPTPDGVEQAFAIVDKAGINSSQHVLTINRDGLPTLWALDDIKMPASYSLPFITLLP